MKRLLLTSLAAIALAGCSSAHPPVPSDVLNLHAKLNGPLPYPVLTWSVITNSIDRTQQTTSTLFGNAQAVNAARSGQASYPQGAMVALATWHQSEDPHWFGARIPGEPAQVELVEFTANGPKYRLFTGSPLAEQTSTNAADRTAVITAMKAVVYP